MQTPTTTSERLPASAGSASFRDPAYRARFVFGQEMKACPKCGGYNIGFSTPINGPLPDSAKGMLAAWAKARKGGATPLEGTCRIMCRSCGHLGPAVNVEGRTAEDVGRDKAVCAEVKRLWNSEQNNQVKLSGVLKCSRAGKLRLPGQVVV
jgi:hypothetical protein